MKQLLSDFMTLRDECTAARDGLAAKFKLAPGLPPIVGIVRCFNTATVFAELTSHYDRVWGSPKLDRHALEASKMERVTALTRSLLIASLSALEYAAREADKAHLNVLQLGGGKNAYLSKLIGRSHLLGFVDAPTFAQWNGLLKLRNALVHNNGVADENRKTLYSNGIEIDMFDGQMIIGKEGCMLQLTRWAVLAYADWCDAFLARR